MRFLKSAALAALVLAASAAAAVASPVAYVSGANDTPYALTQSAIANVNATGGQFGALAQGTASSNAATIQGTRIQYTTASLSTAASSLSAAQTVTDASVTAASEVFCGVTGYSGTLATNGIPSVVGVTPAAGSFAFSIWNGHTTNALSGTVTVSCIVFN